MSESEQNKVVEEVREEVPVTTVNEEVSKEEVVEKIEVKADEPAVVVDAAADEIKADEPVVVDATAAAEVKEDTAVDVSPADVAAILKQVEFYFSDQNFPKDKFLWTTAKNNDGWVPIDVIASFKRMRQFQPLQAIVTALRQSKELLEVNEQGTKVRRQSPLIEPAPQDKQAAFLRTIYAKGFDGANETESTQTEIERFFESFGFEIRQVRLRRDNEKKFKGSVFVEFANVDDANKFLSLDDKPKYNDVELETSTKKAYVDKKAEENNGFAGSSSSSKSKRPFDAFREINQRKRKSEDNDQGEEDKPKRRFGGGRGGRGGRGRRRGRGRR
ncbi:hypothetical protein V1514DRAFT_338271 [Lipomyces japonicus]|uniref:uncharacterized protein n=1 Tax=Lipomyces japonicus TaxID=56871 RepID=UPI0034CF9761